MREIALLRSPGLDGVRASKMNLQHIINHIYAKCILAICVTQSNKICKIIFKCKDGFCFMSALP